MLMYESEGIGSSEHKQADAGSHISALRDEKKTGRGCGRYF